MKVICIAARGTLGPHLLVPTPTLALPPHPPRRAHTPTPPPRPRTYSYTPPPLILTLVRYLQIYPQYNYAITTNMRAYQIIQGIKHKQ